MNYNDYVKQIDENKLIELGLKEEFEEIFNSDMSELEKKSKAKKIFLKRFTIIEKKLEIQKNPLAEEIESENEDDNYNSSEEIHELVLKPSKIKGNKLSEVKNEKEGEAVLKELLNDPFYEVIDIKFSKLSFKPRKPFTTSTLQQAASSYLGLNPKYTMGLAQKLYEGLSIDGQQTALITYMRTDSVALSSTSIKSIRKFISSKYPNFLPSKPNLFKGKSKNAQEAHEAIRPIDVNITPEILRGKIEPAMHKLYTLIWKNTVCSQMTDQIKEKKSFVLQNSERNSFNGSFLTILEKGWRVVFDY